MPVFVRRLFAASVLALLAVCALAGAASAATRKPTVTSVSPAQVPVGGVLVLKGKNFASGASHNRIFFSRASDGKSVRVRPRKATKTRIEVVVPAVVTTFLVNGQATRFQIAVFTKVLGPATKKSRSPIVLPAGSAPVGPSGPVPTTPGTAAPTTTTTTTTTTPTAPTPPPLPDCDGDGTPDIVDGDDDNDGLSDAIEGAVHTNTCNKDTDGDGVEDGFEYYSAKDLNGNALPYPGKRPFPNPLDGGDAASDYDGDGMTNAEEFAAWNLYGGRVLPAAAGQSFPYSDGNQTSPASNGVGAVDLDNNGRITDDEKDTDGDGLPNWAELAKGDLGYSAVSPCAFAVSTGPAPEHYGNAFTDCGAGLVPNGNTFGNVVTPSTVAGTPAPAYLIQQLMNYLDADTDGDGINDGADDNDFDGLSNIEEITAGTDGFYTEPQDPCDPDTQARSCPIHPSHG